MLKKPKTLQRGDTIGVISPASPSYNKSDIIRGADYFEKRGYKVVLSENLSKKTGFCSGTDLERADDMNEMFRRKDIDAVFITQGGYGSARILRHLDYNMIGHNSKIFIGFSDITSLHLALNKKSGIMTFHGPGLCRFNPEELTEYTEDYFFKAVADAAPVGEIKKADEKKWINIINKGETQGQLIGGNLTLICATLGTPYEIDTEGKILFIEETDTEPWILDHMFSHLRNAGKLEKAAGIVIGEFNACRPKIMDPGFHVDISEEDVMAEYLKPLKIPAIQGLPIGHTKDMATLPVGAEAYLNASEGKLYITETATVL